VAAQTDQRMVWRGSDIKSKDEIAFDLTTRHAAALKELLGQFQAGRLALGDIRPGHCRHPALDADLARVFDEIQDGRGIASFAAFRSPAIRSTRSA
jgi:hypothetical protein